MPPAKNCLPEHKATLPELPELKDTKTNIHPSAHCSTLKNLNHQEF